MGKRSSAHTKAQRAGRERDGNRCQICGSSDHVEGHHILDYQFSGAADKDNIIALCHKHHNDVHKGFVGDNLTTSGGSSVWKVIKNGVPAMFKQGPGSRFFNGKENEHIEGVLHTLQEWITDEQKLEFLRKFGWLMKDEAVRAYSAKFKPKR